MRGSMYIYTSFIYAEFFIFMHVSCIQYNRYLLLNAESMIEQLNFIIHGRLLYQKKTVISHDGFQFFRYFNHQTSYRKYAAPPSQFPTLIKSARV